MSEKILHIGSCDKFLPPFIEFIKEHFDFDGHQFYLTPGMASGELKNLTNIVHGRKGKLNRIKEYWHLIMPMHKSKKIILHGLFNWHIVVMLFFMPWLLKKCYWVIWGGDLYVYQLGERNYKWKLQEFFRRTVIKNMGYLVTGTSGDVDLTRTWYGAKGEHISCFNYPSNIYKNYEIKPKVHEIINIQVGNSADPTNQHFEIFNQLERFKDQNIKVFAVLSYGNQEYAKQVIAEGEKRFGNKFIGITEMMPFQAYLEFLSSIDIAIFNHKRQQAFGNAIILLGLGKKIYLNPASTLNSVFAEFGIQIFNSQEVELTFLDDATKQNNIQKVKCHFSKNSLIESLKRWVV
jgi:dTDP-N-acetylfucosamine:lipid II N-acetylfucosaminyltransferase